MRIDNNRTLSLMPFLKNEERLATPFKPKRQSSKEINFDKSYNHSFSGNTKQ